MHPGCWVCCTSGGGPTGRWNTALPKGRVCARHHFTPLCRNNHPFHGSPPALGPVPLPQPHPVTHGKRSGGCERSLRSPWPQRHQLAARLPPRPGCLRLRPLTVWNLHTVVAPLTTPHQAEAGQQRCAEGASDSSSSSSPQLSHRERRAEMPQPRLRSAPGGARSEAAPAAAHRERNRPARTADINAAARDVPAPPPPPQRRWACQRASGVFRQACQPGRSQLWYVDMKLTVREGVGAPAPSVPAATQPRRAGRRRETSPYFGPTLGGG